MYLPPYLSLPRSTLITFLGTRFSNSSTIYPLSSASTAARIVLYSLKRLGGLFDRWRLGRGADEPNRSGWTGDLGLVCLGLRPRATTALTPPEPLENRPRSSWLGLDLRKGRVNRLLISGTIDMKDLPYHIARPILQTYPFYASPTDSKHTFQLQTQHHSLQPRDCR